MEYIWTIYESIKYIPVHFDYWICNDIFFTTNIFPVEAVYRVDGCTHIRLPLFDSLNNLRERPSDNDAFYTPFEKRRALAYQFISLLN